MKKNRYVFSKEDIDKKWELVGMPKKTVELIESRADFFNSLKSKYQDDLLNEQRLFKIELDKIDRVIHTFNKYNNLDEHQEVA